MITRVLLDLDDVLNNFAMAALFHNGATPRVLEYDDYPPQAGWNIIKAANILSGREYDVREFWENLDRAFWASIPPLPGYRRLVNGLADKVGKDNLFIATSATKSPECLAGKLEWIHRFLPPYLHKQYMMGTPKYLMANPFTLLIDDREKNCVQFRHAGGEALMIPRPWNSAWGVYEFPAMLEYRMKVLV